MSIIELGKIDFVSFKPESGEVVLTISDHLDWADDQNHLLVLQDKINAYLEFIESEQIHQEYPESIGRKLRIEIVSQYEYPKEGIDFLGKVKPVLESIGVSLSNKMLN